MTKLVMTLLIVWAFVGLSGPAHAINIDPGCTWGELSATRSGLEDAIRTAGLDGKFVIDDLLMVPVVQCYLLVFSRIVLGCHRVALSPRPRKTENNCPVAGG